MSSREWFYSSEEEYGPYVYICIHINFQTMKKRPDDLGRHFRMHKKGKWKRQSSEAGKHQNLGVDRRNERNHRN